MAELKNQHFVPKVHLRAFSDANDGEKRMINLIHISSGRAISRASISDQCAKHYFYGKDLHLERALSDLEGTYAEVIRDVEAGARSGTSLRFLRDWTFLQYQRTDAARRRSKELHAQMDAAIGDSSWKVDTSDKALVALAIQMFTETVGAIEDLKTVIIVNKTDTDFITSDEPAIIFNKWLHQKQNLDTFGLGNSGLCIYMPLTPRFGVLSYDSNVYDLSKQKGSVNLNDRREIALLNALLMRSDAKNVYFQNWADRDKLMADIKTEVSYRTGGTRTNLLVPVDGRPGTFRPIAKDEDQLDFPTAVIYTETVFPRPSNWFRFLKNKMRPVFFENGTSVGRVRQKRWLEVLPGFEQSQHSIPARAQALLPGLPRRPALR